MPPSETGLFAEERRQQILTVLERERRVAVNDLAQRFGVSTATLRNDLRDMEQQGLLRRTHGGAVPLERTAVEHVADAAMEEQREAKRAIGRAAAELVADGDTLFCDSGSTTLEFVRALAGKRNVTMISNDFALMREAEAQLVDPHLVLLGGAVRTGFHYTLGASVIDMVGHLAAPTVFLAASAFSLEHGFSTHTMDIALLKRAYIARSERCIVLMDSSKVDTFTTVTFAELSDIDLLVTDDGIAPDQRQRIERTEGAPALRIATR